VEDEAENRDVTELRLRDRFELVWAATDREACSMVHKHADRLYAILMDIQLKGSQLDGIQLTKLLRGEPLSAVPPHAQGLPTLDVPIIFVTAYGSRYTEDQLLAVGGTAVVPKPVDFVDLTLALANARAESVLRKLGGPAAVRGQARQKPR
jgi:CheY-like chemotaxis protein